MAGKRDWVVELVAQIVGDKPTAVMVVDALQMEGLLHLGYGDKDIDIVVQKFTDTFGTTKVSRQDRWAANRLVQKYGSQSVCGIVDLLAKLPDEKYKPIVNSVVQLEEKWVSILNYVRKAKGDETIKT